MRNQLIIATTCMSLFTFVSCKTVQKSTEGELVTNMSVLEPVKAGSPVMLKFTVKNTSSKELKFCKWFTPFEGFLNSIFTITDSKGEEARYKGVMAKRMMPPPASAYLAVPAGDSASSTIDLSKAYELTAPGKYKIVYQSSGMSGLEKVNETTFTITE
jgi:hypothetical protein